MADATSCDKYGKKKAVRAVHQHKKYMYVIPYHATADCRLLVNAVVLVNSFARRLSRNSVITDHSDVKSLVCIKGLMNLSVLYA